MEFKTLGKKERKLLLTALGIDYRNLSCDICNKDADYEDCCIMPALKTKQDATILCNNPLCMSRYLIWVEKQRIEKNENPEIKKANKYVVPKTEGKNGKSIKKP